MSFPAKLPAILEFVSVQGPANFVKILREQPAPLITLMYFVN